MKRTISLLVALLTVATLMVACAGGGGTPAPQQEVATKPPLPTSTPQPPPATPTPVPATPTPVPPTPAPPTATPVPSTPTPEAATATPAPTATSTQAAAAVRPKPAALTGRLYFPVFDPTAATYSLYSAKMDGSDRQLLIAEASQPAVSPDGKRIAFRSWKSDARGLIERAIAGGDIWNFDSYVEAARPTFAPDGQSLLFFSTEGGDKPALYHTVGTDHQVLRRTAAPIQGESPAWTPDGKQVVYRGCLGVDCGLIVTNLDGSFPKQLTPGLSDTNPAVSPDGKTVAFMSSQAGNWDVYTVGIDGTGVTQLTTDTADDGLPIWSADGKTIVFVSNQGNVWSVRAMNLDGKNQRSLFELGGTIDGKVSIDLANAHGWVEESIAWGQ